MTELRDAQGYSPSIPGTASARIVGWAGRYFEVFELHWIADVESMQSNKTLCDGSKTCLLTTMTDAQNAVYTKKSPGCENLEDSRSSPLPY